MPGTPKERARWYPDDQALNAAVGAPSLRTLAAHTSADPGLRLESTRTNCEGHIRGADNRVYFGSPAYSHVSVDDKPPFRPKPSSDPGSNCDIPCTGDIPMDTCAIEIWSMYADEMSNESTVNVMHVMKSLYEPGVPVTIRAMHGTLIIAHVINRCGSASTTRAHADQTGCGCMQETTGCSMSTSASENHRCAIGAVECTTADACVLHRKGNWRMQSPI